MAPIEVEQLVTFPVESALMGVPGTEEIRSISKLGLSIVTVVFDDSVDTYFARQLVNERLGRSAIPHPGGSGPDSRSGGDRLWRDLPVHHRG